MKVTKLMCKKDWILDGEVHFKKGEYYSGRLRKNHIRNGIDTFEVKSEFGQKSNFHTGSEYFDI